MGLDQTTKFSLQEKHLDALVRNKGGFTFTDTFFPYTSGEIGPYYVQSAAILQNGKDFSAACDDLGKFVAQYNMYFDVISGGESRDWIFSLPIAESLGKPHTMIYKDGKILGADMDGKRVLHIADLNNEGSSPRDKWVPAIRSRGGTIDYIFFYVDRMERGVQVMKELDLQRQALVPLDKHAWNYLQKQGVVNKTVYGNLRERMEDQDTWGMRMLKSQEGFNELLRLFKSNDEKTILKAKKVLDYEGYQGIRDELKSRLIKEGVTWLKMES